MSTFIDVFITTLMSRSYNSPWTKISHASACCYFYTELL